MLQPSPTYPLHPLSHITPLLPSSAPSCTHPLPHPCPPQKVVTPHALVDSGGRLRLNGMYYITKQIIPAVERVLSLVGALGEDGRGRGRGGGERG